MTTPTRLYRWYDADGRLLYVGISVRPSTRAYEHVKGSRWTQLATRMDIDPTVHPDRTSALAAERAAIAAERPVFNISGASDPWRRINEYLASRGLPLIEAPAVTVRPPDLGKTEPDNIPDGLRGIYDAWLDVARGIESDPDPERAFSAASEFTDLLDGLRRERSAHRASLVVKIRDTYRLTLAELAGRIGVTKTRAGQLVQASARTAKPDAEEAQP